jgi:hypothetical protein
VDQEHQPVRLPLAEQAVEPVQAGPVVGVVEHHQGAPAGPGEPGRGDLLARPLGHERDEHPVVHGRRPGAGDVVVPLAEQERGRQVRRLDQRHGVASLPGGEVLRPAEPLDEVADLGHERDGELAPGRLPADGVEEFRGPLPRDPAVVLDLPDVAGVVDLEPLVVVVIRAVDVEVAEDRECPGVVPGGHGPAPTGPEGDGPRGPPEERPPAHAHSARVHGTPPARDHNAQPPRA